MEKSDDEDSPASSAPLPLFYKSPWPLDALRHNRKSVTVTDDFTFARETNAVPLNGIEFIEALRHYPIVFSKSRLVMSMAVLGIRPDRNLFVDRRGQWRRGAYILAYVRRYLFCL